MGAFRGLRHTWGECFALGFRPLRGQRELYPPEGVGVGSSYVSSFRRALSCSVPGGASRLGVPRRALRLRRHDGQCEPPGHARPGRPTSRRWYRLHRFARPGRRPRAAPEDARTCPSIVDGTRRRLGDRHRVRIARRHPAGRGVVIDAVRGTVGVAPDRDESTACRDCDRDRANTTLAIPGRAPLSCGARLFSFAGSSFVAGCDFFAGSGVLPTRQAHPPASCCPPGTFTRREP